MKVMLHGNRTTESDVLGDGQQHLCPEEYMLLRRCQEALMLAETGDYESARSVLSKWWPPASLWPHTDGLSSYAAAVLLLQAGVLMGCLVSAKQTEGAQAHAKKLILKSMRFFKRAGQEMKAAEAQAELAWCHWMEGDIEGARRLLEQALATMGDSADCLRAKLVALLHLAVVELESGHRYKALTLLKDSAPLFHSCDNDALKGKFYSDLGIALKELGQETGDKDFLDRAVIEHSAALYHFNEANAGRLIAQSENNLGFVLFLLGTFDEAAKHLRRAHRRFTQLGDAGHAAQVKETQAQLALAREQYAEAERLAAEAVRVLEAGERPAVLAEALTTKGVAQARAKHFEESHETLVRAIEIAEAAGARKASGLAALSAVEELRGRLNFAEARKLCQHARALLAEAHDHGTERRLTKAVCWILDAADSLDTYALSPTERADESIAPEAPSMRAVALRLSGSHSPALITGELKARQLLARYGHELSERKGSFVAIDCDALEEESALPEFLGWDVRGGAGVTLYLDSVQELSTSDQERLLRLIKHGVMEHTGAKPQLKRIDVRVVAGTPCDCDLSTEVALGFFSSELFDWLSRSGSLSTPPTEAIEELRVLAGCFIKEAVERCYRESTKLPEAVTSVLLMPAADVTDALAWQLVNMSATGASPNGHGPAEQEAMGLACAGAISGDEGGGKFDERVDNYKIKLAWDALKKAGGHPSEAAHLLGIPRQRLEYMINTKYPELQAARTPVVKRSHGTDGIVAVGAHKGEPEDVVM